MKGPASDWSQFVPGEGRVSWETLANCLVTKIRHKCTSTHMCPHMPRQAPRLRHSFLLAVAMAALGRSVLCPKYF